MWCPEHLGSRALDICVAWVHTMMTSYRIGLNKQARPLRLRTFHSLYPSPHGFTKEVQAP